MPDKRVALEVSISPGWFSAGIGRNIDTTPHKAGALQTLVSSSSPPLASPHSGRTTSLFQNHQAPRRAFHGNFTPCQALPAVACSDQLLYACLRNKSPWRQDYHQQFLCNVLSLPFLRNKTASHQSVGWTCKK